MKRLLAFVAFLGMANVATAQAAARLEFNRLLAHWDAYGDPDYLKFVDEARPEVCQVGFYGAHFWSLAHTPSYKGYPAHFPVQGLKECGAWFADLNQQLHRKGVKVVGHFNVEFLVGDPETPKGPTGFFKFYRELWDENLLGKRPVADPIELLERNADGTPITNKNYGIGGMREHWGCLNNPHWRAVLKAWVKVGIERGVDGFISNYFYRHNCLCEHCQANFRAYLKERYTSAELEKKFGIRALAEHRFDEILFWHDPAQTTPFRLEQLRFSQIAIKRAYEDVFVKYGRSLKPGLILAQWNHLGDFSQIAGDERCLLPAELWGKDEDYAWYSTGSSAFYTDLANGFLGEGTLQARYLRGAFDNKPFTLGKYEATRTRVAIAEMVANGGAAMGFYTRFKDPLARKEIARYYRFLEQNERLLKGARSHAEVVLLFPRSRVHQGDIAPVAVFKKLGKDLLDRHVLFDVLPDDLATPEVLARYRRVVRATEPTDLAKLQTPSRFQAPSTVRVSANRSKDGKTLTVHFVNYNREEPQGKKNAGRGIVDEKPIAVKEVQVELAWSGKAPARAVFLTPEHDAATPLRVELRDGRLRFTTPEFLVYGVVALSDAVVP